jgi:hypothetical protein
MKTKYRIWTGDGSHVGGSMHDSLNEAIAAVKDREGWTEVHLAEHCDGGAWSCYASEQDAEDGTDGGYAVTISRMNYDNDRPLLA